MMAFGEALSWFGWQMSRALDANAHKGGWTGDSALALLRRLRQETDELDRAIRQKKLPGDIIREAADVANFAMMIADNARVGSKNRL